MSSPRTDTVPRTDTAPLTQAEHDRLVVADRHVMHTMVRGDDPHRIVIVRAEGCRLWDTKGRRYLDATAGLALSQVGHGRRELGEVAAAQMAKLEYFHTRWGFTNDRAVELAARLVELAPEGLNNVHFTSGGAEGNEMALRLARFYRHRTGQPDRTWILALDKGFHGITYGASSMSGGAEAHTGFGPMLPHVRFLTTPDAVHGTAFGETDVTDFCLRELRATIEEIGPDRITAMIGEPVLGPGGMIVPPDDYWPRVAELLHSYGILLISDEIVTAYGRLGHWFAAERTGVTPDILVTAKGITSGYMPHGAVLVKDAIAEAVAGGDGFPVDFSYSGHPTACAVALANLDIIAKENLLGNAVEIGAHLGDGLRGLLELPVVGQVRQIGLMVCVELTAEEGTLAPLAHGTTALTDELRDQHGLLVRGMRSGFMMVPPLVLTREEADEAVHALRDVLGRMTPDGLLR
ncbi:putrescine aminotransferase [Streptomyces sp. yr375]|uniref:aminotransferase family protein n=1 Tax=Streptomyces sp. yr375 TaxID=1761906 RepID=UPI0008BB6FFC|nr:aspartate aminotransferase family protein [Streptomyces sp. yr375]SEQ89834.1 putrescine aminotransferase [Streptomyces sp. yr375]